MTRLDEFKVLLRKKIEIMERIFELTKKQPGLMVLEDVTGDLMLNIQERQNLIDELDAIQGQVPDRESIRQDSECSQLAADVQKLLLDIQKQDTANEKFALKRMDELRGQLRKSKEGQITFKGYEGNTTKGIGAMYFDKQK